MRATLKSTLPLRVLVTILVTMALALAAESQSPECLTTLQSCEVCLLRSGQVDIRGCGGSEPVEDVERLHESLLQRPDVSQLEGLHRLVADRTLEYWDSAIHPVLVPDDGNRIYVPRELYQLASDHTTASATGEEWRTAAENAFIRDVIRKAAGVYVEAVPTGTGDTEHVLKSTDILLIFVLRLLDNAGAFDGDDLSVYLEHNASVFGSARLRMILDQVLDVATCLRGLDTDVRPEDALLAVKLGVTIE